MDNEKKPASPLSELSPKQQERLKSVSWSLLIDKITISHSIEERARDGRKMNAFYSVTASRGTGAEITQLSNDHHAPIGWSPDDTRIVRLVLGKHVIAAVYDDAVKRGMLSTATAQEELRVVLTRYDNGLAKILQAVEEK